MAKGQKKQKQDTIAQQAFEEMCKIQCTKEEICAVLDVSNNTLLRWCKETYDKDFGTIFKEKRQGGKASLRRMQWKQAEKNPTMAIWLGKQYLDQKDKFEEDNTDELKQAKEIIVSIRKTAEDDS